MVIVGGPGEVVIADMTPRQFTPHSEALKFWSSQQEGELTEIPEWEQTCGKGQRAELQEESLDTLWGAPAGIAGQFEEQSVEAWDEATELITLDLKDVVFMGVRCTFEDGGIFRIKSLRNEGAVADWNARSPPGRELVEGSQILSVNGIRGEHERILEEFKKVGPIHLVVRRRSFRSKSLLDK